VLDALEWAVWSEIGVVSVECAIDGAVVSVECAIDGAVVCALDDALSLFLFLLLEVDFVDILVKVSAVAGDMNRDH